MRIRKNAKVSPLVHMMESRNVIQTYDCRLNQSPWDVMSFSPPSTPRSLPSPLSSPVNRKNDCAIGGSAPESIPILKRSDGNNWQCKRKVENEILEAQHHPSPKRAFASLSEPSLNINNSHEEDYYYSDFGPQWGKKQRRS